MTITTDLQRQLVNIDQREWYYLQRLIDTIKPWIITPDNLKPHCQFCHNSEWVGHGPYCPYKIIKEWMQDKGES